MYKLYTIRPIAAEQFTNDCIPEGVIAAPKEFLDLALDFQIEPSESVIYIYKIPFPDDCDIEFASYLNVPYPFQWIQKGDYVVEPLGGNPFVVIEKVFKRDFYPIEILDNQPIPPEEPKGGISIIH